MGFHPSRLNPNGIGSNPGWGFVGLQKSTQGSRNLGYRSNRFEVLVVTEKSITSGGVGRREHLGEFSEGHSLLRGVLSNFVKKRNQVNASTHTRASRGRLLRKHKSLDSMVGRVDDMELANAVLANRPGMLKLSRFAPGRTPNAQ